MTFTTRLSLFGLQGERKYLNHVERTAFYVCANQRPIEKRLFCLLLLYTGARISEIYELSPQRVDFINKSVILRTLKRRRSDIFRQVPLPDHLLESILVFINSQKKKEVLTSDEEGLWPFAPRTASRIIKQVMNEVGISGVKSSSLGLRHGFAVNAASIVPLTKVQKWMGHSRITTTAIYLDVSGAEERKWAEKLWNQ